MNADDDVDHAGHQIERGTALASANVASPRSSDELAIVDLPDTDRVIRGWLHSPRARELA